MEHFILQPFSMTYIFTYIRLVCYALIIITSLRNIVHRKFTSLLFVGDIIACFALFIVSLNIISTQFNQTVIADKVITPAVMLWAGIHFYEFLHLDSKKFEKGL